MENLIKMRKMSIVEVELKYSNTGSEQLFYMEKCLIYQSSFPGHFDLWDLRIRIFNFFKNFLIIRKNYCLNSCSEPHLQGIDVNAVVIENLFCLLLWKGLLCQKLAMSSWSRKRVALDVC